MWTCRSCEDAGDSSSFFAIHYTFTLLTAWLEIFCSRNIHLDFLNTSHFSRFISCKLLPLTAVALVTMHTFEKTLFSVRGVALGGNDARGTIIICIKISFLQNIKIHFYNVYNKIPLASVLKHSKIILSHLKCVSNRSVRYTPPHSDHHFTETLKIWKSSQICQASSLTWQHPLRPPASPPGPRGIDGRAARYAGDWALGLSGLALSCSRFVVPLVDTWGTIKLKIIGSRSPLAIDPLCEWTLTYTVHTHSHLHTYISLANTYKQAHTHIWIKAICIN